MPQVTRLSRASVVGFRGSPMGPRPPAAGVGCGCVIDSLLSVSFATEDCLSARGPKVNDHCAGTAPDRSNLGVDFAATFERATERELVGVRVIDAHRGRAGV